MVTSVRDSDRVFRCDPDVFREGFGRLEEDMLCDAVGWAMQSYKVLGFVGLCWGGFHGSFGPGFAHKRQMAGR